MRDTLPFGDVVPVPALDTLSVAKEELFERERFRAGSECPCCGQFVKLYRRKLSSNMAAAVCWVVREHEKTGDWVHLSDTAPRFILRNGGEFSLVKFWDLIRPRPNDDPKIRTSGDWRPTESGIEFAHARLAVPSHLMVFNNTPYGFDGDKTITVREALGERFDYEELMRGGKEEA